MAITDVLIYTAPNGSMKVVYGQREFFERRMADKVIGTDEEGNDIIEPGWTEEECWDYIKNKRRAAENDTLSDMEQIAPPLELDEDTFRGAWFKIDGGFDTDMTQAREIAKDYIRHVRDPKLEFLDGEWHKARAKDDAAKIDAIDADKQTLRDAPQDTRLTDAATPDDLKIAMNAIIDEIGVL